MMMILGYKYITGFCSYDLGFVVGQAMINECELYYTTHDNE